MTIEIKRNTNQTTIDLVGRLDTLTAPALEKTITDSIGSSENLVLDFKGLEYISSAGLRVLLGTQKRLQKSGSMKLIRVCEDVMEVLEMTGFADILTIE
jgi:anti-sigma B factor antagonist